MRTIITPKQQAGIEAINADPFALGIAPVTLDALVRKGLARDLSGGNRLRYELTLAGRLLLPGVDVTAHQSSVALAAPALFPTTDEDF
jgi:hypothetical protein